MNDPNFLQYAKESKERMVRLSDEDLKPRLEAEIDELDRLIKESTRETAA